ncbi:TetR/AcrR family transcriptional regulator [Pseudohaliea rubra]|uniref:Transcriptional regulator, TetR family n=1 Tax=Pseudohaliea rubra DSM 19751 TaxID=1265313 RepID=A0A095VTS5_9GAMM|nr:TetR/AcrR family transcriptional regulator [Pseudohaliea rubra]KGE04770.1 Transcriptional regulator, TetR family [Pseudohaliea rubra DSM 19751]
MSSSESFTSRAQPFNRQAQHDAKRAAILSEAARLFNGKGSRATTLQDIAASLGLTKTSLYYYVRTKEELIYQCYLATLQRQHQALDEIEAQTVSPVERILAFLKRQFEQWQEAREGRDVHLAALLEIASLKDEHRDAIEQAYISLFKRLRSYLRDGMADGSLRSGDSTSMTRAIIGSLDWLFHWLHSVPEDGVQVAAAQAADLLLHGLYAGPGCYHSAIGPADVDSGVTASGFDRDEQNRLKQEAFYKAGTWLFNRKGFNGASLDEIADYLSVSKGAFYYHIRNKEDLLYNCYNQSLAIVERVYREAESAGTSGIEKIDYASRRTFLIQNSGSGPLIRYNTITALPTARRLEVLARTDTANNRFVDFLAEGVADGSIRPVDPLVARNLLAGAINASMDISLWRRVGHIDDAAREYFDLFFNGLLHREPEATTD